MSILMVESEREWKEVLTRDLRLAREVLGRTQLDVAIELGCGQGHFSSIERGRNVPSVVLAMAWARAVGLDWAKAISALRLVSGRRE